MEDRHDESSHRVDGEGVTLESLHSCILELTKKVNLLLKNPKGGGLDDNKTLYKEHDVVAEDDVDAMVIPKKRKRGDPMNGSKHPPAGIVVAPMANQVVENKQDGNNVQSKASVSCSLILKEDTNVIISRSPTQSNLNEDALVGPDDAEYSLMETLEDDGDVLKRYTSFKKFDTVMDHSDHYFSYIRKPTMECPNECFENIKKELKDLEEHLPGGMYVRVYESRMDLLTVVIIGPKDTPYYDGLFFFDVCFTKSNPEESPLVQYHSFGFSIHPYIYSCGIVGLFRLDPNGGLRPQNMWVPGTSNLLQLMVNLQSFFNSRPLFDNALCAVNTPEENEQASLVYNEDTIVKNLKTMVRLMEKPPKDFVDLVVGHFHVHASHILTRVGRHLSDLHAVGTHSTTFKSDLDSCINPLVAAFKKIGVKYADKFVALN